MHGNIDAQYKLAEYYFSNSINKNGPRAIYLVAKCYRDGIGIDKNIEVAIKWIRKYESLKTYRKPE